MKTTEEALRFDGLAEAERITGKSYKESAESESLGVLLHMLGSREKSRVLSENNDTHFSQTREEFESVLTSMGFELVLCEDIPGTEDKLRIYWRNGLLLRTDSYFGDKSVNGGNCYFNFKGPREGMFSCSNGHAGEIDGSPVWDGDFDVREGLRFRIERMEACGEILPKWHKRGFLWLLHYMDTKKPAYDYNAINAERIARLPIYVRAAIAGAE